MANRRLTEAEIEAANEVLGRLRAEIVILSAQDSELRFAFNRKIAKELIYDERSKPMVRRALKAKMRRLQNGTCPICSELLPQTYCVLDRFEASLGYVQDNVRLICETCDRKVQQDRRFR